MTRHDLPSLLLASVQRFTSTFELYIFIFITASFVLASRSAAQDAPSGVGLADPRLKWTPAQWLTEDWNANDSTDWNKAAILGLLSKTAYEDDTELMNLLANGMGFTECRSFMHMNSAAHALVGSDVIVLAFRGTEFTSLADWKTDAYLKFLDEPGIGKLHSGFNQAYQDVRQEIEKTLAEFPGKKVWVTGHSLGGAMAVICAMRLKKQGVTDARIVTFGQPRVGNNLTAQWIDSQFPNSYQRIVNDQDVVPTLPPTFYFKYADAGRYIEIGKAIRVAAVPGTLPGEDQPIRSKMLNVDPSGIVAMSSSIGSDNIQVEDPGRLYQSQEAKLPKSMTELDQLIRDEQQIRNSLDQSNRLYFPYKDDARLEVRNPVMTASASGAQPVGGIFDWFNTEPISDHYMAGYLEFIRKYRDEKN